MTPNERLREISEKTGKELDSAQINVHVMPCVNGEPEPFFCTISVFSKELQIYIKATARTEKECFDNIEALLTSKNESVQRPSLIEDVLWSLFFVAIGVACGFLIFK